LRRRARRESRFAFYTTMFAIIAILFGLVVLLVLVTML